MKKIFKIIIVLLILCTLVWSYLTHREQITLKMSNTSNSDVGLRWACNSVPKGDSVIIAALSQINKTIYPRCEGEFGLLLNFGSESKYVKIKGYIPIGKPMVVDTVISNTHQVKFTIEK